jgi:predicted DNA-binding protein (MmcQ/YjbR family)
MANHNRFAFSIFIFGWRINKMNREDVLKYVKEKYNIASEYLWKKNPCYAVFRHQNNKWFGIIMNISKEKLGLDGNEEVDIINVKCPPEIVGNLRRKGGFFKAYHMNKEHWVTIILDGSVSAENVKNLIDWSFELTSN